MVCLISFLLVQTGTSNFFVPPSTHRRIPHVQGGVSHGVFKSFRKSFDPQSRIVGGSEAADGQFPFMALLVAKQGPSFFAPCGGSLIAPDTVLSAAHCFSTEFAIVGVVIGDLTPFDPFDSGHYIPLDEDPILHPNYNEQTFENDLMILRLRGSSNAKPLQLVFEDLRFNQLRDTGTSVKVVGWGTTSSGGISSDRLRSVDLVIAPIPACNDVYGLVPQDKMICAWHPPGGKDSCQGDSGGPLFYQGGSVFVQIGVVSFGLSCALPNTPGVYTNVANYENFIRENSGNLGAVSPNSASGAQANPLDRAPLSWICPASFYVTNDGNCVCGCGLFDADCETLSNPVFCNGDDQAASGYSCLNNVCRRNNDAVSVPPEWQCDLDWFNRNDGCDCGCGAADPDCEIPGQETFNCLNGEVCQNGLCLGNLQQGGPFTAAPTLLKIDLGGGSCTVQAGILPLLVSFFFFM